MSNKLYLKYAKVIEMCEGTIFENSPMLCVQYLGVNFTKGDNLYFNGAESNWKFAVGILEDKPVFLGDTLYSRGLGNKFIVDRPVWFEGFSWGRVQL